MHDHGHGADHDHEHEPEHEMAPQPGEAVDPVCGMIVEIEHSAGTGLSTEHEGTTYYFCGRGCKLDFGEDPARYLDPGYQPSM